MKDGEEGQRDGGGERICERRAATIRSDVDLRVFKTNTSSRTAIAPHLPYIEISALLRSMHEK